MAKYTKWKALGSWGFGGVQYLAFVRKNKKNGLMQFKTKRMHGKRFSGVCDNYFRASIDTQKVWDDISNE